MYSSCLFLIKGVKKYGWQQYGLASLVTPPTPCVNLTLLQNPPLCQPSTLHWHNIWTNNVNAFIVLVWGIIMWNVPLSSIIFFWHFCAMFWALSHHLGKEVYKFASSSLVFFLLYLQLLEIPNSSWMSSILSKVGEVQPVLSLISTTSQQLLELVIRSFLKEKLKLKYHKNCRQHCLNIIVDL